MKLEGNEKSCAVHVAANLDAAGMDDLISRLAELRAGMAPAVPMALPNSKSVAATNTPVSLEDEPAISAKLMSDGRPRLFFRNKGFGWLAFDLAKTDAAVVRDWLTANLDDGPSLFGVELGQGH